MAKSHYENFTVASWLLPRTLRSHFHAVYAWCRWADDLADETMDSLGLLQWWRRELNACYAGQPTHPVTVALRETLARFAIPQSLFNDLLSAFEQDQHVKDYDTFDQLSDYCRRSANPVGRIVLHLFECFDEPRGQLSDRICTGLQLANFWQDVARDFAMGRIYLPREDRRRFACSDDDFPQRRCTEAFRAMMRFEVERARAEFDAGHPLIPLLPRRARVDVALFHGGGEAILDAIEGQNYDVWSRRPNVSKWKKLRLLVSVLPRLFR